MAAKASHDPGEFASPGLFFVISVMQFLIVVYTYCNDTSMSSLRSFVAPCRSSWYYKLQ